MSEQEQRTLFMLADRDLCSGQISSLLSCTTVQQHQLHALLEHVQRDTAAQAAALFILANDKQEFACRAARGNRLVPPPSREFLKQNTPNQSDTSQNNTAESAPGILTRREGESLIFYHPCIVFGQVIAYLGLTCTSPLENGRLAALTRYALFTQSMLERQTLLLEAEHYRLQCEFLQQLNSLLHSDPTPDRLGQFLAVEGTARFSADLAAVMLRAKHQSLLTLRAQVGLKRDHTTNAIPCGYGSFGKTLLSGGILALSPESANQPERLGFLFDHGVVSLYSLSLESRGSTWGVLLLGFLQERHLSGSEAKALQEISRATAMALATVQDRQTIARYNSHLDQLVREQTSQLEKRCAHAEESAREQNVFISNMSHEIRTPLTAIVGYASTLARGVFGEINSAQKDALASITRAADHLKDLINEVLQVSRLEAGKEAPKPSEVNIPSMLKQVQRMMMQTALAKNINIAVETNDSTEGEPPPNAWVDPRHLSQITINLLSNAIKYTPDGGSISLQCRVLADKIQISVKDSGVGIAPDELQTLFDRFARGSDQYSQTQLGTGIGLSLTKQLVEMNGGEIGATSTPGQGSTFWILVPRSKRNLSLENSGIVLPKCDSSNMARLDGLTVLIADDNQLTCEVLASLIQRVGGTPHVANSVAQALELTQTIHFDSALIDLAFPGESGMTLLQYFNAQAQSGKTRIPLLVVSACVFDKQRHEALQNGASTFIPKPFDPSEVVNLIRSLTEATLLQGT